MRNNNIEEVICVACPKGCRITIESKDDNIIDISGYSCEKGKNYAKEEFENPTRILPTTVRVSGGEFPLVSVKTEKAIPKERLLDAMDVIAKLEIKAPINNGDIVYENILNTGVNLIATRRVAKKDG